MGAVLKFEKNAAYGKGRVLLSDAPLARGRACVPLLL